MSHPKVGIGQSLVISAIALGLEAKG
jgi:hypothetical protein